ncbi:redoxin family protein [Aromatoleum toluvorans]|uniref:Redoxin family protein n=1 Tax=Aromatoleum toluvorans TaxID=92002 RepID=A0ABX1Q3C9_9RHOO|nr:TlpA disulfide reductase family protein [Aromatoleum toluvorans]NMG45427.1 redoxin family protein [Aromatoleum toluvorans]
MRLPASVRNSRRLLLGLLAGLALAGGLAAYALHGSPATAAGAAERSLPRGVHFQDGQGKALSPEDFRGRVVLLNVWATWCVPCRKEMPALDRLQKQLGGPAFEVVAVSIDQDANLVREFYLKYGIRSLALYIDPTTSITSTLGTVGIPTTLLVDQAGREVWRKVGPAEWDAPASVAEIRKHLPAGAKP